MFSSSPQSWAPTHEVVALSWAAQPTPYSDALPTPIEVRFATSLGSSSPVLVKQGHSSFPVCCTCAKVATNRKLRGNKNLIVVIAVLYRFQVLRSSVFRFIGFVSHFRAPALILPDMSYRASCDVLFQYIEDCDNATQAKFIIFKYFNALFKIWKWLESILYQKNCCIILGKLLKLGQVTYVRHENVK